MRKTMVIVLTAILAGCAARSAYDRAYVSRTLEEKTGHSLPPPPGSDRPGLPPGVVLDDGLAEDEAVAVALWNNAQFQADMSDLAVARAGLIDAGMLPNPLVSYLHLFGVKGQEGYILWPLDALVQRPKKMAAARLDVERVASRLVQTGLALARDTLVACADLAQTLAKEGIAKEDARIGGQLALIAAARLKAGDISGLEEATIRVAGHQAQEAALGAARDARLARARLAAILGWGEPPPGFELSSSPPAPSGTAALPELLATALAARPDLAAARLEIDAAAARLGWERARVLKLTATLEGKEKGDAGLFVGPSGKIEIPIFNRNEGGRARAKAEMEKAAQMYVALRQRVQLEVTEAVARLDTARQAFSLLSTSVVPAAAEAFGYASKAYASGQESYLFALEAEHRYLEARRQEAAAAAELKRAEAHLTCGLGSSAKLPAAGKTEK